MFEAELVPIRPLPLGSALRRGFMDGNMKDGETAILAKRLSHRTDGSGDVVRDHVLWSSLCGPSLAPD